MIPHHGKGHERAKSSSAPAAQPKYLTVARESLREARLRELVEQHVDFVARVLRNAGTPEAEVDDNVQRTFITASNRLEDVREGAEKSFLLQIALRVAAHARRTVARRREVTDEDASERLDIRATPEEMAVQQDTRRLLDRVLRQMDPDLRLVFTLHEFEELSMAEIAGLVGIPQGTVASRLRRARVDFRSRVRSLQDNRRLRRHS